MSFFFVIGNSKDPRAPTRASGVDCCWLSPLWDRKTSHGQGRRQRVTSYVTVGRQPTYLGGAPDRSRIDHCSMQRGCLLGRPGGGRSPDRIGREFDQRGHVCVGAAMSYLESRTRNGRRLTPGAWGTIGVAFFAPTKKRRYGNCSSGALPERVGRDVHTWRT
jgi:hypothetical protein